MIKIKSQDGKHQYDGNGNIITMWDGKKCAWIVETKYENEKIDWYGKDSDFPAGETLANFIMNNPDWDKNPDIKVVWTWNEVATLKEALGCTTTKEREWYKVQRYPYSVSREWGYLDYSEQEAIDRLATYCDWDKLADNIRVVYNNKTILNGKMKKG